MNDFLSPEFWSKRYQENQIGWDLKQVSPPIKEYIDQLTDKELQILIPGCGLGYEGEYLFKNGFTNVHLLDFSEEPILDFQKRNPTFPATQLHTGDFFTHKGSYDLILEQTLFCAIDPTLRAKYAQHASSLLKPGGKLVGVLFNRDFEGGPPFGGNTAEYHTYFKAYFSEIAMESCHNSIEPRKDSEVFVKFVK
jgi:SAM-dependent methyltransferase